MQPKAESSEELETYDIYLLPPNEDPETCQSWLRMRNRSGRYMLMFEEWVTDGSFIITPRITFEVSFRLLAMAPDTKLSNSMQSTIMKHWLSLPRGLLSGGQDQAREQGITSDNAMFILLNAHINHSS